MAGLSKDEAFREFISGTLSMRPVTFGGEYAKQYMGKAYERFGREAAEAKKK
jgi:hypothetical protein